MPVYINPKERAHMLYECISDGNKSEFLKVVEGGLRMAVEVEREACAKLAEKMVEFVPLLPSHHENNVRVGVADRIAKAIRARKD